ncbi:MAG: hypothetical protein K6T16_00500 [Candidatus Pacearchaeota archaeon]|nr:hypothetical protein [Candidatus Pacearchaeota archaeon]
MLNKRGFELGWQELFTLIFIIAIVLLVSVWIGNQASGIALKKQILAKEVCLIATSSQPGTTIIIEHDKDIIIEKKDNGLSVKAGQTDRDYFYDCYLEDIEFSRKDDFTIIEKGKQK